MIENTKQLIEQWPEFDAETRNILLQAVSTRGKHKGFLLSSAPNERKRPLAWLAWQVLVSNLAPARASMWGLIFSDQRERFTELDKVAGRELFRFALNAVEPQGRWNLWCMHNDSEASKGMINHWIDQKNLEKAGQQRLGV